MTDRALSAPQIRILAAVLRGRLKGRGTSSDDLAEELSVDVGYVDGMCRGLAEGGLLIEEGGGWALSELGRSGLTVVFTGGVFDIIHPGHIFTLSAARRLGDFLVVSVARDKTVRRVKGRDPLNDEARRVEMVGSLRFVDVALLGSEVDIFDTVVRVKPDIVALGYDQRHREDEIRAEGERRGLRLRVVRLSSPIPDVKSSDIIRDSRVTEGF